MLYKLYKPHPALEPYVRYYWSLEINFPSERMLALQLMADRFPRIVVQCLEGRNALHGLKNTSVYPACIKGVASEQALIRMEPRYSHIAVSLFPHALQVLFGLDAREAANSIVDLTEFCSPSVVEKIIASPTDLERVQILESFLLKKLSQSRMADCRITDFIFNCHGPYAQKLKEYGVSERHFERKFLPTVGMTPSTYKRIFRFEQAMKMLQSKSPISLPDTAYTLRFSDQSHFNREFKLFSGLTPTRFLRKENLLIESGSLLAR